MTWARSTIGVGQLLAELVTTAVSALILRPVARVLQLVDDAHDVEEPDVDEPHAAAVGGPVQDPPRPWAVVDAAHERGYLIWSKRDTGEVIAIAELGERIYPACSGDLGCLAQSNHMLCCPSPSRRIEPDA